MQPEKGTERGRKEDIAGVSSPDVDSFLSALHWALKHLYDLAELRKSPLTRLFGVSERYDPGLALRNLLLDAIQALRPSKYGFAQGRAWRLHRILSHRFAEQLSQKEVATELGLSVRQLRREEQDALVELAHHLRERHRLPDHLPPLFPESSPPEGPYALPLQNQENELVWLQRSQPAQPTEMRELMQSVLTLLRPVLKRSRVHVECTFANDLPQLAVKPAVVRQALVSILLAAIHASGSGEIRVEVTARQWEVIMHISLARLHRASSSTLAEDVESLALARKLISLTGGALTIHGDNKGVFLHADVTLPAAGQVAVLVIDDNPDALELLRRYVLGTRYQIVGVRDPEQALSLIQDFVPKIIVVDVMLPGIDGWELLGRLREHPLTSDVPIIVCTILMQEDLAMSLGASAFLHKPITRETLLAALDQQFAFLVRSSR